MWPAAGMFWHYWLQEPFWHLDEKPAVFPGLYYNCWNELFKCICDGNLLKNITSYSPANLINYCSYIIRKHKYNNSKARFNPDKKIRFTLPQHCDVKFHQGCSLKTRKERKTKNMKIHLQLCYLSAKNQMITEF